VNVALISGPYLCPAEGSVHASIVDPVRCQVSKMTRGVEPLELFCSPVYPLTAKVEIPGVTYPVNSTVTVKSTISGQENACHKTAEGSYTCGSLPAGPKEFTLVVTDSSSKTLCRQVTSVRHSAPSSQHTLVCETPARFQPFFSIYTAGGNMMWGPGEMGQSLVPAASDVVTAIDVCADPAALPQVARVLDGAGLTGAVAAQAAGEPTVLTHEGLCAGRYDTPMFWTRFVLAQPITLDPSKTITVALSSPERWGVAHSPSALTGDAYPQGLFFSANYPAGADFTDLVIRLAH